MVLLFIDCGQPPLRGQQSEYHRLCRWLVIHAEIMARILRMRKSFTACFAVNVGTIRRTADRLAPGMGVNGCVIGRDSGRGFSSRFGN